MAKIFKKDDSLKTKYVGYCRMILIGGCLFGAGFLSVIINIAAHLTFVPLTGFGVICCFTGVIIISLFGGKASSLKSGIKGESRTAELIERLPEGYYGIQNATVSFEGKSNEIDMIVVGPSGVFIVESKSRNGHITGDFDSKYWTQHKVGRGGTPYSSDFYSPVKQVGTHIYRLAHFLRSNGAQVNVEGAVYMSGEDYTISLSGTPGRIPVFTNTAEGRETLYCYILSGKTRLQPQNVNYICNLLLRR